MLVAVGYFFNPNDYKGQISAAVAKATGRTLTLDGDLALSTFPTIRIQVGSATLSNAQGFGPAPMAKIGGAELRVSLLPLLFGKVELGKARLSGLELNLARDARGRNNWQDLGGAAGTPAAGGAQSSKESGNDLNLGVGSLEVDDARVTWNDASTGSKWELTGFGLDATGFGVGKRFPLQMRFTLAGADVTVKVDASTDATLTLASDEYRLDKLLTKISGSGKGWPGGQGDATLKIDSLDANLGKETLDLNGLSLTVLGITTTGSLKGTKLMSDLSLVGRSRHSAVQSARRRSARSRSRSRPRTRRCCTARARRRTSPIPRLKPACATCSSSSTTRRSRAASGSRARSSSTTSRSTTSTSTVICRRPARATRRKTRAPSTRWICRSTRCATLNAEGSLKFGKAKFSGLTVSDAAFGLTAANGMLKLTPTASLYGGKYGGDIAVAVQKTDAKMTIAQHVDGVDLDPLGKDLLGAQYFTGTGDVKLDLVATGSNLGADAQGRRRRRVVRREERLARGRGSLVRAAARARACWTSPRRRRDRRGRGARRSRR